MNHFFQDVPGFAAFRDIYAEMVSGAADGAHFVEVGSFLGKSAVFMAVEIANSGKQIRFDCVDSWAFPPKPDAVRFRNSAGNWRSRCAHNPKHNNMFKCFRAYIKPVSHLINAIKMESVQASNLYDDASLDFVFIDANHQYEHVFEDISAWLPKVKPGGLLAGDDFNGFPGVAKAVTEIFEDRFELRGNKGSYWLVRVQ